MTIVVGEIRNFAHVFTPPGEDGGGIVWRKIASGSPFLFSGRGQLLCRLEEDIDPADANDPKEARQKFDRRQLAILNR